MTPELWAILYLGAGVVIARCVGALDKSPSEPAWARLTAIAIALIMMAPLVALGCCCALYRRITRP